MSKSEKHLYEFGPFLVQRYSVMILSAHSTSDTKMAGLPNFAPQ